MLIGNMTTESLMIAVSGIVIVFIMLAVLSIIIVAISRAVGSIAGSMSAAPAAAAPGPAPVRPPVPAPAPVAAPVQLSGVNDLTAACIMAIVSDELGVTPDQLVFKSIRAL
ncbi:OadG family transporter subunit [Butyricicoccus faecihominis]|uniref:OadG family transporter subunit n=1 Tax=Butyricicoccaceae TaxID=3085642 RepID=UPI00247A5929|nr:MULTISPECIES: OadG family transporter subunit [Butyricicoccaceae]MCQ5128677.1 OadG family transporter subunit [Butyricicoccus faecihominis]WNX85833.1 OadG family transporter subunit [Agathobaculum sp. NTUH-O15-33]